VGLFHNHLDQIGFIALAPTWLGLVCNHAGHFWLCMTAWARMLLDGRLQLSPWIQLGQYLETTWIWWEENWNLWDQTPPWIPHPTYVWIGTWQYSSPHLTKIDRNLLGLAMTTLEATWGTRTSRGIVVIFKWLLPFRGSWILFVTWIGLNYLGGCLGPRNFFNFYVLYYGTKTTPYYLPITCCEV